MITKCGSTGYIYTVWLGVKHQVTYFLPLAFSFQTADSEWYEHQPGDTEWDVSSRGGSLRQNRSGQTVTGCEYNTTILHSNAWSPFAPLVFFVNNLKRLQSPAWRNLVGYDGCRKCSKVLSAENPELLRLLCFNRRIGQNKVLCALPTAWILPF